MDTRLDAHVRTRAGNRCEYCHMPQSASKLTFPIDHIIARQHGGQTVAENLALCCGRCNRHRGPNIAGIDPETSQLTRLFHPRLERWEQNFRFDGVMIRGSTPAGRATVMVLNLNHVHSLAARQALVDLGHEF